MSFEDFFFRALDDSLSQRDETGTQRILVQASSGLETWTLFDGELQNTGTGFGATGSFLDLDLVRSDDGTVTFGEWPDPLSVDFYVPAGEEITVTASISGEGQSAAPEVCEEPFCGDYWVDEPWEECDPPQDDSPQCGGRECLPDCTCYYEDPYCGDDVVNQAWEECDGTDNAACRGRQCYPPGYPDECECALPAVPTPTLPHWGLIGLGAVLFVGGALVCRRRCAIA